MAPGAVPESTGDTNVYDLSPHTARDVNLETEDKVKDLKREETVYDLMDEPNHGKEGNGVQELIEQSIRHKENQETDLVCDMMAPEDLMNEDQSEGHGDDQSEDKVKSNKVSYKLNKNDKTVTKPTDRFKNMEYLQTNTS